MVNSSKLFAMTSYARGELCYEDRLISKHTDNDFNEACMQYHFVVLWAGANGTLYEFVLTINPIKSGHQDHLQLIVNPAMGSKTLFRLDIDENKNETNTVVYGGHFLMDSADMQKSSCYGGGVPLNPTSDCPSKSVILTGYGMGVTDLNMYDGIEKTINKLIALRNLSTGDVIDNTDIESGVAKVMFKPLNSAIPSEKTHWFDAFVDPTATELDGASQSVTLGDCDPRNGTLSESCNFALASYITTKQTTIKNRTGASTVSTAAVTSTGLRVAQYNGTEFDRTSIWTLGSSNTNPTGTGASVSELIDFFNEANHDIIKLNRTRCDFIKCFWYEAD